VPLLMTSLVSGKTKLPSLSGVLDWRKAAPQPKASLTAPVEQEADDESADSVAEVALPPLDPAAMTHFISIQSVLDPGEAALAREVAASLSPGELRAWIEELSELSVPDAVKKIRTFLKGAKS